MTLERRIITGLIVSADFLKRIKPLWRDDLVPSPEMARIASWCLDFFEKYHRAPDRDIEGIYMGAIKDEGIPKAEAEMIEDILRDVSDDYERGDQFNSAYLYDQTVAFFRECALKAYSDGVRDLIERGELEEAEAARRRFKPVVVVPRWRKADQIKPRRINWLWPDVIPRGDITLLAGRPKIGKSQLLMSIAAKAPQAHRGPRLTQNVGRATWY